MWKRKALLMQERRYPGISAGPPYCVVEVLGDARPLASASILMSEFRCDARSKLYRRRSREDLVGAPRD
jgi:hypothetical protein